MKFLTKAWIQTQLKNFADRISDIFAKKTEIDNHCAKEATQSILGHVRLSNSAAITTAGEYALDAIEKNASIEGTLANMIGQANSNLTNMFVLITDCHDIPNNSNPVFFCAYTWDTPNAPSREPGCIIISKLYFYDNMDYLMLFDIAWSGEIYTCHKNEEGFSIWIER